MADVITMPKLGFDMAEGVLVRWVLAVGDDVNAGDVIAEIETDKATVEVESGFSGVVKHHLASEGDILPIGEPIAVIGDEGEDIDIDEFKKSIPEKTQIEEITPNDDTKGKTKAAEQSPDAEVGGEDEYPQGIAGCRLRARRHQHPRR